MPWFLQFFPKTDEGGGLLYVTDYPTTRVIRYFLPVPFYPPTRVIQHFLLGPSKRRIIRVIL